MQIGMWRDTLGKRIGRPRVYVDADQVIRMRNEKLSLREIARKLDIPVSRVRRTLARSESKGPPEVHDSCFPAP